jgi:hypothetical protein
MAKFGLACEGITDQIVLENILCGFYHTYDDLDEEIIALEPPRDETDRKQEEATGGWTRLLTYLSEKRFRDDVLNNDFIVIQIDTDISDEVGFDVFKSTLSTPDFIKKVIDKLIEKIGIDFYREHKNKILFALSVHTLECWILPIYKKYKNEKKTGCVGALKRDTKELSTEKNYKNYDELTKTLTKNKKLLQIVKQNISFEIFIKSLPDSI